MIKKIRIMCFWCIAFTVIIWNTLRGRHWNMIYVDFQWYDEALGEKIRKQLIAKKDSQKLSIYWQNGMRGL